MESRCGSCMVVAMVMICAHGVVGGDHKTPAVFTFGDSIMDTGNNNVLLTVSKCNFPPYGKDFIDHRPTGRFSNGKVPSDMIVSALGIKELLPPYLTTEETEELLTGVSFASGGTGFDPLTPKLADGVLSMADQLSLFGEYKTRLATIAGEDRANWIVSNGLHVVCGGTNDVLGSYFDSRLRMSRYDVANYVRTLVTSVSDFVRGLYKLGARKIGIVGLPPIGCLPSQITIAGIAQRNCVLPFNQAAIQYNNILSLEIQHLSHDLPDAKIVYVDIYSSLADVIGRPSSYGFVEATKGCCGTGLIEMTILCNSLSTSACDNEDEYVFWDSVHPTQKTYQIIVDKMKEQYLPLFQ